MKHYPGKNLHQSKDMTKKGSGFHAIEGTLQDYAKYTTVHGISYIFEASQPRAARWSWVAVVTTCLGLVFGFSLEAFRQWKSNQVVFALNSVSLPIKEIEFPSISICAEGVVDIGWLIERKVFP